MRAFYKFLQKNTKKYQFFTIFLPHFCYESTQMRQIKNFTRHSFSEGGPPVRPSTRCFWKCILNLDLPIHATRNIIDYHALNPKIAFYGQSLQKKIQEKTQYHHRLPRIPRLTYPHCCHTLTKRRSQPPRRLLSRPNVMEALPSRPQTRPGQPPGQLPRQTR